MTRRQQGKYPNEVRRRTVRLVLEHRDEYASAWAAITSIAAKPGMTAETLRTWVRQTEVDEGRRPGGDAGGVGAGAGAAAREPGAASGE